MTTHRLTIIVAAGSLAAALLVCQPAGATATAPIGHTTLVPVGGGYEADTERQFAQTVAKTATGTTIDFSVVPSSYGDAPEDRETNLAQAQLRTDELDTNCEAAIDHRRFTGCTATLLTLLNRADAENAANSAALDDPGADGVFILGGDQVLAMRVLANTPAEAALTRAHARGVVISGTSAGNAVESRSMITGYQPDGYPETGLQKAAVTIGWGDTLATDDRGLAFGSRRFIFDQHFYQRGRFGRLLNITAQSVDRYGNGGKLGLGTDFATGPVVVDDEKITGMIGQSSSTILNFDSASKPRWVGKDATLSTKNVLTHLIAPGAGQTYDAVQRRVALNGQAVSTPRAQALPQLRTPGRAALLLGGGGNNNASSTVLASFIKSAKGSRIVIVAAGYPGAADAAAVGASYHTALTGAGWRGTVTVLVQGKDPITPAALVGAAGVLFLGGDQSLIGTALSDSNFASAVRWAVLSRPAVLTEGAMTAAMAVRYNAVAGPTSDNYEDEAIRYFRTDAQVQQRGLGVISGVTLEPALTHDYRWGLLFGSASGRGTVAVGISERTAIALQGNTSAVVGARSVVSVDGRQGWFGTGSNGAIAAINTYVSTFADGDRLR